MTNSRWMLLLMKDERDRKRQVSSSRFEQLEATLDLPPLMSDTEAESEPSTDASEKDRGVYSVDLMNLHLGDGEE